MSLFEVKCISCHGQLKQKGGLDMRTLSAMLKGGESGPGFIPGEPQKSPLFQFVADNRMPPAKKLSDAEKALIRDWILEMPKGNVPVAGAISSGHTASLVK